MQLQGLAGSSVNGRPRSPGPWALEHWARTEPRRVPASSGDLLPILSSCLPMLAFSLSVRLHIQCGFHSIPWLAAVSSWVRIQCSFHGYRAVVTFSLTTSSRAPRLTGPHNHSSLLTHARGCSEGVHSVQLNIPTARERLADCCMYLLAVRLLY